MNRKKNENCLNETGVKGLSGVTGSDKSTLKLKLVYLETGFRLQSIIHGCVAEIIFWDQLIPEAGVLPPSTQMTNIH